MTSSASNQPTSNQPTADRTASDRAAVEQLLATYNMAIDLGDIDTWVSCFTDDGEFVCDGLPEGAPLGGLHRGKDALHAYGRTHYGINKGRARHWNWNLLLDVDGDTATLQCYLNACSAGQGDSATLRSTGIYRDRLVRTADGWRFRRRHVTIDPA
ncbi:MAG: nuclear transport factor 2 family protein [Acidimicrobiales bacterium]